MCAAMRTTLILDDQLFRRAKREAGDMGAALSELVNTALRSYFFTKKSFEQTGAPLEPNRNETLLGTGASQSP